MALSLEIEQKVELSPRLRQQLEAALSTYNDLSFDAGLLEEQLDVEHAKIGLLLEEAGIDKAAAEGLSMYWTRGSTTKRLDKKKLIAQGVTTAMIAAATTETPKKPFFTIRDAKRKSKKYEEDEHGS